jgi:hypothetical protein
MRLHIRCWRRERKLRDTFREWIMDKEQKGGGKNTKMVPGEKWGKEGQKRVRRKEGR